MTSLKKEITSGVFYIAISRYSGIILNIFISAILARLVPPSDFGLIAIVNVVMTFFYILSDIGLSPAIVQKKELTKYDLDHIFSFTFYMGLVLTIVFFICAWPLAYLYNEPQVVSVAQLMSIVLLFNCIKIVPIALLTKAKRFKFQSFTGLSVGFFTSIISVSAAYMGFGVYALILSGIISNLLILIIFYFQNPLHLYLRIDLTPFKKIFSYSAFVFLFNSINYFSRNLDKLLVGKYLNLTSLAYYEKSYNLMMMPLQNITFVITPVLHPIFSEFQNDLKFVADKYLKLLVILAYISFPLSAYIYFVAPELIQIIYGPKWLPAITPFKILALTLGQQILISTTGSIFQAVNSTKLFFIGGCICAFLMITSFFISLSIWGTITALAWGFLIAQTLNSFQTYYLVFKILLHSSIKKMIIDLSKPLLSGIILFIILFLFSKNVTIGNLFASLIIKSLISILVWTIYMQFISEYGVRGFFQNFKMK